MSFLARLLSDNYRSLKNVSGPHIRKKFLHSVRVLVYGNFHVRFDLPSSINFRDITGSPNWGPRILIRSHLRGPRVALSDFSGMISY